MIIRRDPISEESLIKKTLKKPELKNPEKEGVLIIN